MGTNIICFLSLYLGIVHAANRTDVENVHNYIFSGYNRDVSPYYNKTLNVSLLFMLFSIVDFDEVTGVFSTVSAIILNWDDERLKWDQSEFTGVGQIRVPSEKIWYPDVVCLTQSDKLERIGDGAFYGDIQYSGSVRQILGTLLKTSCAIDMTFFPFDEQICKLEFCAWGYSSEEIHMVKHALAFDYLRESPRWVISGSSITEEKLGNNADSIVIEIKIKRRPQHFILTTLSPIVMLLILNPFVFVLPVESGERTSYTVTIFLSQVVFMTLVGQNMPNSANPMPRISYFLLVAMAFSIIQTLTTIALMGLTFTDSNRKVHPWLIKLVAWACSDFVNNKSVQIDSIMEARKAEHEVKNGERATPCEPIDEELEHSIAFDKLAKVLSRVAFVVSLFTVFAIVVSMILAMNV